MNNEQLKQALMTERPVIYYEPDQTPVRYAKIQRIIYQKQHSQIQVSAEVLDRNHRSVRVVNADRLCFEGEGI